MGTASPTCCFRMGPPGAWRSGICAVPRSSTGRMCRRRLPQAGPLSAWGTSTRTGIRFQNASTGQLAVWFMSNNLATDGTFVTPGQQAGWRCVSVVDLNGDGWPDLVFQNTNSGQLGYWLMNGVKAIDGNLFTVQPPPGWQVAGLH